MHPLERVPTGVCAGSRRALWGRVEIYEVLLEAEEGEEEITF